MHGGHAGSGEIPGCGGDPFPRGGPAAIGDESERAGADPAGVGGRYPGAGGPSEIRRIDQQRAVFITVHVSGVDLGTFSGMIQQALERIDIAEQPGVRPGVGKFLGLYRDGVPV